MRASQAAKSPGGTRVSPGAVNSYSAAPSQSTQSTFKGSQDSTRTPSVFVAGSIAVDLSCDYKPAGAGSSKEPILQTSNPATISQSLGGVGQNVARAIHLLNVPVRLCTMVGGDLAGSTAKMGLESTGMDTAGVVERHESRTSQYIAVNAADKSLVVAMADMEVMEGPTSSNSQGEGSPTQLFNRFWKPQVSEHKPSHVVIDANWRPEMLHRWLKMAKQASATTLFEPVSTAKATRVFQKVEGGDLGVWPNNMLDISSPNRDELTAMNAAAREAGLLERNDWWEIVDAFGIPSSGARTQLSLATSPALVDAGIPQQSIQLLPFIPHILTKLGSEGVLLTQIIPSGDPRLSRGDYAPYIISRCNNGSEDVSKVGGVYMRLLPAAEKVQPEEIVSVNGVGDTFLGAIVAGLVHNPGSNIEHLVLPAQQAAVMTLRSKESVSPLLTSMKMNIA